MDKTIIGAGIAMLTLGVGFLIAAETIPTLHSAYITGGYLWTIIGGITSIIGYRVHREKQKQLSALR
ncbi:MAG: hypothetical protein ACE5R3_04225 [Nitrosopumilaceae archaeon]